MRKLFFITSILTSVLLYSQDIEYGIEASNGALNSIKIQNDKRNINWILYANQKPFIETNDLWGLGKFTQTDIYGYTKVFEWKKPDKIEKSEDSQTSIYTNGGLKITVSRKILEGKLLETYSFKNITDSTLHISDVAVNTPFNDNYDNSDICLNGRTHAHIWAEGGDSAYICAINMGANPPHLGLLMSEGAMTGYEVRKRDVKFGMSNFRGVLMMNLENFTLEKNQEKSFSWIIFSHKGWSDFFSKAKKFGSVIAQFKTHTTAILGEKIKLTFNSDKKIENPKITANGKEIEFSTSFFSNKLEVEVTTEKVGEIEFILYYGDGKWTKAVANVVENPNKIISKRSDFILKNQQMNNPKDRRFGAYMVYDNIENKIYLNNDSRKDDDVDEGAERLGMGIFLARLAQTSPDNKLNASLIRYADFVRNKLQTSDFTTYSTTFQNTRNRFFNYPWVARFYCEMYRLTKEKKYLKYAVGTMNSFYKQFGYSRYTLDTPVFVMVNALREAGMQKEADECFANFKKTAEIYIERGSDYPKQEVDYEQSIVAPAAMHLLDMFLLTKDRKWLEGAKVQLKNLEAFDGLQPHYRLHNIAIRHWDAFWFGKRRIWGDTFPHYWTCLSSMAYSMYADASDEAFRMKAENGIRACLSLFYGDGRATCAYVFPNKVNDMPCKFSDEFANDQDWALAFYLMINNKDY